MRVGGMHLTQMVLLQDCAFPRASVACHSTLAIRAFDCLVQCRGSIDVSHATLWPMIRADGLVSVHIIIMLTNVQYVS